MVEKIVEFVGFVGEFDFVIVFGLAEMYFVGFVVDFVV